MPENAEEFDLPPPVKDMLQALRKYEDRRVGDGGGIAPAKYRQSTTANNTPFSLSEFARLCVILRDDSHARKALLDLNNELTLQDFRANFTRDDLWREIAKRFNDISVSYEQAFSTSVPEACSADPPLCARSAERLKDVYQRTPSMFTQRFEYYSRSGNNDPDSFPNYFWPHDREVNVVVTDMKCVWIFLSYVVSIRKSLTTFC